MRLLVLAVLTYAAATPSFAADPLLAPTGTLRAVYIVANLAQATRDPTTGEIRGVVADIARELARRAGVPVVITPIATARNVLEAVRTGAADIGFVAPNPERTNEVLYSQTYMLVQQSALVRDGSPLASVHDLDRPGAVVGVNTDDSVGVWLKGQLKQARLKSSPDYLLKEPGAWLQSGEIQAFAGNRQRLGVNAPPGTHLLPDNLYAVHQTIAVGRPALLPAIDAALDDMRTSGFLASAMKASGVDGIEVAPRKP